MMRGDDSSISADQQRQPCSKHCRAICSMSAETIHKSVPLTREELASLEAARTDGTAVYDALAELIGPEATRSEAATLKALIHLGFTVVKERAMDNGYAAHAASQDQEDRGYEAAMRKRVRDSED